MNEAISLSQRIYDDTSTPEYQVIGQALGEQLNSRSASPILPSAIEISVQALEAADDSLWRVHASHADTEVLPAGATYKGLQVDPY